MSSADWLVVTSASGKTGAGLPIGYVLCRDAEEVKEVLDKYGITHPLIQSYDVFLKREQEIDY